MTTSFSLTAETETHFIEADCEVDYGMDGAERYPIRYRWYDVIATDKKTNESECWGEEMPDSLLNTAKEKAEELFDEQY